MNEFDEFEPDNTNVIFRDVILLALLGFMAVVIIMIAHINPPGLKAEGDKVPGSLIVEINWDQSRNVDVDLWLQINNERPNGYSNKSGQTWNLLRDDLGFTYDITPLNYEIAYTRGIVAGEYIINLHLYKIHGPNTDPIKVQMVVSIQLENGTVKKLWTTTSALSYENQELTVTHLMLTKEGEIAPGSMHDTPYMLRSRK